jgi:hypothetical protein
MTTKLKRKINQITFKSKIEFNEGYQLLIQVAISKIDLH